MREIKLMTTRGGRAGWCPDCQQPFGNLANHVPFCSQRDHAAAEARQAGAITRAAAHATAVPRPAQTWLHGVTDNDVALVMYAIEEMGVDIQQTAKGVWTGWRVGSGIRLHWVVDEMVRTGLVRHMLLLGPRPTAALVPAPVHLRGPDGWSACHFTGEDLGPMRSRLIDDLTLVDCANCEVSVATGQIRAGWRL